MLYKVIQKNGNTTEQFWTEQRSDKLDRRISTENGVTENYLPRKENNYLVEKKSWNNNDIVSEERNARINNESVRVIKYFDKKNNNELFNIASVSENGTITYKPEAQGGIENNAAPATQPSFSAGNSEITKL